VIIVESLLKARLFDKVLLGPFPSCVLYAALGRPLNAAIREDLTILARLNGSGLQELIDNHGTPIVQEYSDRIVLPEDFLVAEGDEVKNVSLDELETTNLTCQAIGENTLNVFTDAIGDCALLFHFGMLGSATPPFNKQTQKIIDCYANAPCTTYMAGDHIIGMAYAIGVQDRINHFITGAQTTSFYLTGKSLPGLIPFLR
jgi:3-phosphoglycerate kinase